MPECLDCGKIFPSKPGDKPAIYGLCKECDEKQPVLGGGGKHIQNPGGEDRQSRLNGGWTAPLAKGADGRYTYGSWYDTED
jgi:hypothetical protein